MAAAGPEAVCRDLDPRLNGFRQSSSQISQPQAADRRGAFMGGVGAPVDLGKLKTLAERIISVVPKLLLDFRRASLKLRSTADVGRRKLPASSTSCDGRYQDGPQYAVRAIARASSQARQGGRQAYVERRSARSDLPRWGLHSMAHLQFKGYPLAGPILLGGIYPSNQIF